MPHGINVSMICCNNGGHFSDAERMKKSAQRDANTARWLYVVRRSHKIFARP